MDYAYSPAKGRFVREHDSTQFTSGQNTVKVNGGTSDEFRYNNSGSQTPNTNIKISESISGSAFVGLHDKNTVGNETAGASAEVKAGAAINGGAKAEIDRNSINVGINGAVEVGVSATAEVHGDAGFVDGSASAEARIGADASVNAGLSLDMQNGLSGEISGQAFAGGEVKLEAGGEIGDTIDANVGVDLKAGIGIEAHGDVEISRDRVGVDVEIGATLGIGLDVKVDVSVSPTGLIDDIGDTYDAAKELFGN